LHYSQCGKAKVTLAPAMHSPIRIALVEDDAGLREMLGRVFERARDFRLCGAYMDGETAIKQAPANPPDVVLMDIRLPGMSGIECLRRLKACLPGLRVIVLTVCRHSDTLFEAFAAGADGYLLKGANRLQLLEAVREVTRGGSPVSSPMTRRMVDYFQKSTSPHAMTAQRAAATVDLKSLTLRERQVLTRLADGLVPKEVAAEIGISRNTVRNIITSFYKKLNVHSRSAAILKFLNGSGSPDFSAK
jgi:DNA-binding NarL/FixJ family response regulator